MFFKIVSHSICVIQGTLKVQGHSNIYYTDNESNSIVYKAAHPSGKTLVALQLK